MDVHYLEIVSTDVDGVCRSYSHLFKTDFSEPIEALGHARVAPLAHGGRVGVRAPMHEGEAPTTRSYALVDDVEASLNAAVAEGAEIVHPAFELPGEGIFAIFSQGDVMHGLWQR